MALAALKLQLRTWEDAITQYEQHSYQEALSLFDVAFLCPSAASCLPHTATQEISDSDSARIFVNVALIHREMGQIEKALQSLTQAISLDQTLAVAYVPALLLPTIIELALRYFERAFCNNSLGNLQEASDDLSDAALFLKKERQWSV